MSKINHARPSLRYLDNLRRELSRYPSTAAIVAKPVARASGSTTKLAANIQSFTALTTKQQQVLGQLINTYGIYMDAITAHIESIVGLGNMARREKLRDASRVDVVNASVEFVLQCLADEMAGAPGVLRWYAQLQKLLLKAERPSWSELNTILNEDCLTKVEARLFSGGTDLASETSIKPGISTTRT